MQMLENPGTVLIPRMYLVLVLGGMAVSWNLYVPHVYTCV